MFWWILKKAIKWDTVSRRRAAATQGATRSDNTTYRLPWLRGGRRSRPLVASRAGGDRSDVTYKVATHKRAVNAARAYCLRSRDEPFSRARRAARLTGRGAVNRTLGGESGGNR